MDARDVHADEIGRFCRRLLDLGCAYFGAWGEVCERVHDIMDEEIVGDGSPQDYLNVMTTWHAKDSLQEALWFFLNCTDTSDDFPEGCDWGLVLAIGAKGEAGAITEYLKRRTRPIRD